MGIQDFSREEQEKQFEIHLRKDLPRSIKICQDVGRCGKIITLEEDGMLIQSSWADKVTEEKKSLTLTKNV